MQDMFFFVKLDYLLDETKPIQSRLNEVRPGHILAGKLWYLIWHTGSHSILQIVFLKIWVWNNTSDMGWKSYGCGISTGDSTRRDAYIQMTRYTSFVSWIIYWPLDIGCFWWVIKNKENTCKRENSQALITITRPTRKNRRRNDTNPDFQRVGYGWWHILSLLASISNHIDWSLMMLSNGNEQVRFKTRPVEGVVLTQQVLLNCWSWMDNNVLLLFSSQFNQQNRCHYGCS